MSSVRSKFSTEDLHPGAAATSRRLSEQQARTFEGYIAEILAACGLNLELPPTADTPRRFLQALLDATEGYEGDPKLVRVFDTECRGGSDCRLSQIIEGPIPFASLCEHHAFPFYGRVYIGYIPHEHIFGLSKLVRLVRLYTRRFAVQERIGRQIADTMVEILQPHAVAVYVTARHMCIQMRGVRAVAPHTRTTVWRGEYERNRALRAEFLAACGVGQRTA
ncbi:MAG TPA: GTP cyclohydrolase I [Phycisphaerae bacterium]|jgi:GTP cyclohydrolase I|nr:GTP cyclohydrolase I [Phycisphaerae bacterium]HRT41344.1 GTP cyclohydrolase I [Phycisphaerae bacterium]